MVPANVLRTSLNGDIQRNANRAALQRRPRDGITDGDRELQNTSV